MTNKKASIESLRDGLVRIAEAVQGEDALEPDFQAQSAALDELEAYRDIEPAINRQHDALRARAEKAEGELHEARSALLREGIRTGEIEAERDALAVNVKALESFICEHGGLVNEWANTCPRGTTVTAHVRKQLYRWMAKPELHTAPADLAAHDAKVREPLVSAVKWVLADAKYKAPEQFYERSKVWWARLSAALDATQAGEACAASPQDEHDARVKREALEGSKSMVDDLAMLVRLLVHSIRKHSPDNETARKAMDYLRRHELQGSPLRTTILSPAPDAAKPNNQQEQP